MHQASRSSSRSPSDAADDGGSEGFTLAEVKVLVAFLETSRDLAVVEDVLVLVLNLLSRKALISSLVQHTYALGGCYVFLGLLSR